jgi:hypothetical protein
MIPIHLVAAASSGLIPLIVKLSVPPILRLWGPGMGANPLPHLHLTPLTPLTPLAPLHLHVISTFRRTI